MLTYTAEKARESHNNTVKQHFWINENKCDIFQGIFLFQAQVIPCVPIKYTSSSIWIDSYW